jgi:hypothetical protein
MATFTTRAVLRKPATGDNVNVVTDLNDNFDQIDEHLGMLVCTSATRPTGSDRFTGRNIFETYTKNRYVWDGTAWFLLNKLFRVKDADENVSSTTIQDDNHISFALDVGTWIVDLVAHVTGDAANDVTMTWSFSGGVGNTSRACLGPAGSGGDTENTVVTMNGQSISTNNSYALDTNTTAIILEHLHLVVQSAGTLTLRWARAANTVPGTATSLTTDTHAWAERVA